MLRYLQERNQIEVSYSQNAEHTRFAVQAYAGLVLSRSQQAPLGALRSLFDRRTDARSGLPLVQLSVALEKMGDKPRADQAMLAGLAAGRKGNEWLADYGSPLRDQALITALAGKTIWPLTSVTSACLPRPMKWPQAAICPPGAQCAVPRGTRSVGASRKANGLRRFMRVLKVAS